MDKMISAKTAYYEAASRLFNHISDADECWLLENELAARAEEYLEALLELAGDESCRLEYRKASADVASRLRPFVFEPRVLLAHYREA